VGNRLGFTGHVFNPETGLYTARFRHYSPRLGRFIQRDPAGFVDGMSLYAGYFASHVRVDPLGLDMGVNKDRFPEGIDHTPDPTHSFPGLDLALAILWITGGQESWLDDEKKVRTASNVAFGVAGVAMAPIFLPAAGATWVGYAAAGAVAGFIPSLLTQAKNWLFYDEEISPTELAVDSALGAVPIGLLGKLLPRPLRERAWSILGNSLGKLHEVRRVIIGENMKRVAKAAERSGANTIRDWESIQALWKPFSAENLDYNLKVNAKWVYQIYRERWIVRSIGRDEAKNTPSEFFDLELEILDRLRMVVEELLE
jgi:RHS repeat-associated protein